MSDGVVYIIDDAEDTDHWGWQDWLLARLVVEGDVATGDWNVQLLGTIGQTMNSFTELPHDIGVFRRTKVQAVSHSIWASTGYSHVAVCLSQGQTCTHVRVQLGVAAGCIGRNSHAAGGFLIDAQDTGVRLLSLDRISAHIAVILVGDKFTRAQRRRRH